MSTTVTLKTTDEPLKATVAADRFASLRKAQETLAGIGKGNLMDEQPAVKKTPDSPSKSAFRQRTPATEKAVALPAVAASIQSKTYNEASEEKAAKRFSPSVVPSRDPGLNFDALKIAHQKLGRDVSRQDDKVKGNAATAPAVAVDGAFFETVNTDAKLFKLIKLVDQISVYYKADSDQTKQEKAFLATLSGTDLDGMRLAYEVAHKHVMVMTSDLHAQRQALESNRTLREYYAKNGTSEDQLDAENTATLEASAKPAKRPKR